MPWYADTYNSVTTFAPFRLYCEKLLSSKTSEQKRDSNALCLSHRLAPGAESTDDVANLQLFLIVAKYVVNFVS